VGKYVIVNNPAAQAECIKLAKGTYQVAILEGMESLSGATLRGRARNWSGRYKTSRGNLLGRIKEAGLPVKEVIVDHGRRVLVFGECPAQ